MKCKQSAWAKEDGLNVTTLMTPGVRPHPLNLTYDVRSQKPFRSPPLNHIYSATCVQRHRLGPSMNVVQDRLSVKTGFDISNEKNIYLHFILFISTIDILNFTCHY